MRGYRRDKPTCTKKLADEYNMYSLHFSRGAMPLEMNEKDNILVHLRLL